MERVRLSSKPSGHGALWTVLIFATAAPIGGSQVVANPQSDPPNSAQVGQSPPEGRAAQWERRRREKLNNPRPRKPSKLKDALLRFDQEGQGQSVSFRFGDFYPNFGTIVSGSSLGPGIRYIRPEPPGKTLSFQASAAYTIRAYREFGFQFGRFDRVAPFESLGRGTIARPFAFDSRLPLVKRLFLYADVRYRNFPQEDFFGLGSDSRPDKRSDFQLEGSTFDAVAGYQISDWLAAVQRVGYQKVDVSPGTDDRLPDTRDLFDDASAPGLEFQPDFFRWESTLFFEFRDRPGDTHKGGVIGLSLTRYDELGGDEFEFTRLSLDARHYLPLGSRQRVLALRVFASQDDADRNARVPFYLQQTLGSSRTMRGYRHLRFRDTNLFYLSAEYRWEAAAPLEFALFYDTGKVFSDGGDFDFAGLRKGYGAGIRLKTADGVVFRFDVGHSEEGTRAYFKFGPAF